MQMHSGQMHSGQMHSGQMHGGQMRRGIAGRGIAGRCGRADREAEWPAAAEAGRWPPRDVPASAGAQGKGWRKRPP